jgi:hypothetical protein
MKAIPGFHPSGQAKPVLKRSRRFSFNSAKEVSKINLIGSNLNKLCLGRRLEGWTPGINAVPGHLPAKGVGFPKML